MLEFVLALAERDKKIELIARKRITNLKNNLLSLAEMDLRVLEMGTLFVKAWRL
jgi:hypothetical protein